MTKIFQLASLSLCATALAATAHASRVEFAPEQISAFTELSANSQTDVSSPNIFLNFDPAASRQGFFNKHELPFGGFHRGSDRVSIAQVDDTKSVPDDAATLALVGFSALSLVVMRRKFLN